MLRLFIDTNVLLDIAFARQEHVAASQQIFSLVESGKAQGYVSALTCTTVYYLIQKESSSRIADAFIRNLIRLVSVVEVNNVVIERALDMGGDFEDHVQAACAHHIKADYVVTRNVKDFKKSQVPARTPQQVLLTL